jgi:hypothetical protein
MKQIIAFNEEYLNLDVRMFIPEEDGPEDVFRNYVRDRTAYLLDITKKEAEVLMDDEDDNEVNICNGCASIRYGDYNEFLRLSDTPEPPADKDGTAGEKVHARKNDGKVHLQVAFRASARYIADVFVDENTASVEDVIELGNEKFQEADIGDLEDVDGEAVYIEDDHYRRIWEKEEQQKQF